MDTRSDARRAATVGGPSALGGAIAWALDRKELIPWWVADAVLLIAIPALAWSLWPYVQWLGDRAKVHVRFPLYISGETPRVEPEALPEGRDLGSHVPDFGPWRVRGDIPQSLLQGLQSARAEGQRLLRRFGSELEAEADIHSRNSVERHHQLNQDLENWSDETERLLRGHGRRHDADVFANCPKRTTRVDRMRCHLDRLKQLIDRINKGGQE